MRRLWTSLVLSLLCAVDGLRGATALAAPPVPVNYAAYDAWNAIRTPRLSDDGRYLAYALTPDYGDPTLVVRDLDSGAERREARGTAPRSAPAERTSSIRFCRRSARSKRQSALKNPTRKLRKTDWACSKSQRVNS
jgi:hypothetical protein